MAIQSRRGAYADFDPNKMLPGEWAVVTSGDPNDPDGRAIYLCYIAGIVERMATYEDMKKNVQSAAKGERGSRWDYGTKITGTSTSEQIFSNSGINDANKGDYYLNISTGYVYYCTVGGLASVAKWKYIGSIKGPTGPKGSIGNTGATGATGPQGPAATIQIGTVTTGKPGTQASVTNTGTENAAVLNFAIPRGDTGAVENLSQQQVDFSEASQRQNIQSEETLAILFGKIKKYFSDVESEVFEKLKQDAESESAQSGAFLLGNLKIQWGRIDNLDVPASGSIQTDAITFPHAYGAPPFLTCIPLGNYYLAANPTNNVNLSQASFRVRAADGAVHNDRSILWLAIGY